jgi:hypothetical protein
MARRLRAGQVTDGFTTTQYPVIDLSNGRSVQGEIRVLNEILKKTVYGTG